MNDDTIHFMQHLFINTHGYFELTMIHPTRDKGHNIRCEFYELGRDRIEWDRIENMNADGWGVYYGVSTAKRRPAPGHRRRESDVLHLPCLFAEFDLKDGTFADVNAILSHLYDFDFPPSFLIASGGGVHSIWLIDPVTVTKTNRPAIKETLRGLAMYLRADTSATDLARVLRMPGTINTKPERNGAECYLIDHLTGQFRLEDFTDYRAYAAPMQRPIERELPRYRPDDLPAVVQAYLDSAVVSGQRNNELNKAAFIMHTEGYTQAEAEQVLAGKAMSDGLSERETLRTIQSAYQAAPGTPRYLSRRGGLRMRAGDALRRVGGAK